MMLHVAISITRDIMFRNVALERLIDSKQQLDYCNAMFLH